MTKVYKIILENVMLSVASEEMPLCWVFQQDNNNNPYVVTPIAGSKPNRKSLGRSKMSLEKLELSQKVQEIWYNTPVETCHKVVDLMPIESTLVY